MLIQLRAAALSLAALVVASGAFGLLLLASR